MSVYSINTLSPLANNVVQRKADTTLSPIFDTNSVSSSSVANHTDTLTQDILNTLQNFGFDTSVITPDKKNSIQNFVFSLNQSLSSINDSIDGSSNTIHSIQNNSTSLNLNDANSTALSLNFSSSDIISGGTNFKYRIDLSQANLGSYQSGVIEDLKRALNNISQYISSDGVFSLNVIGQNLDINTLAQANAVMVIPNQSINTIDTSFVAESTAKTAFNKTEPDANLIINLSRLPDMSFSGSPDPNKVDLTTVLTHEVLHGLAFTGTLGNTNTDLKSQYDKLVTMQGNTPYFIGTNAENANGGNPVPLAPEAAGNGSAFYHLAIPGDLMSTSLKMGQVKTISPIDVGILQDIGISINNPSVSSNISKIQNTYGNANNSLQNQLSKIRPTNELNSSFDNLIQSFNIPSTVSTNITLSNFLAKLDLTSQNSKSFQNTSGTLLSVTA